MTHRDGDLYQRGSETLLASWEEIARGAAGAALHRLNGVAAAVIPSDPERTFYNNALLDRDLGPSAGSTAVEAMQGAFAAAGVENYAAWVHENVYSAIGFRDLGRIYEYGPATT
jgi:hypothetical protein